MATKWPQLISPLIIQLGDEGGLSDMKNVVAHTGFEPVISALRGRRPGPLDECATGLAAELGFEPRLTDPESVVLPLHHSARVAASEAAWLIIAEGQRPGRSREARRLARSVAVLVVGVDPPLHLF